MSNMEAFVYCRVSSAKQVTKGDGLGSQETRCREYAKYRDYDVVKVFRDEGVSGGLIDRAGMQSMLSALKRRRNKGETIVIIDDISRLARGLDAHIQLRSAISVAGGKLESPSIEFGEDSDSVLVENLLASVSQHARQKNAEQVSNRMRARVMNGYWCFHPPIGYRFERVSGHGKLMVLNEPLASVVKEGLKGFASGRFGSQAELKRFYEAHPIFPKNQNDEVHFRRIEDMLNQPIYAGYMNVPTWNVHMHPGKHEAMISFTEWKAIQARLKGTQKLVSRIDTNEDFPLRGFVKCACCSNTMTAAWSKGRNAKYAYYFCQTRDCPDKRKSIRKDAIENDFEALLERLEPNKALFEMAFEMLSELWVYREQSASSQISHAKTTLKSLDKKLNLTMDRLIETESEPMITAYEQKIQKMEEEKLIIKEKMAIWAQPRDDFRGTY